MSVIKIKRGTSAPGTVLNDGELGYDTTNHILYVGNGVGNAATPVAMSGNLPQVVRLI